MPGRDMSSAVSAGHVFDGKIWLDNYGLLLDGGNIQALLPRADIPRDIPHNNLGDLSLAPGLIDIQVNGGGGVMLNNNPSAEGVACMAQAHRQFGTTGLAPTVISDTPEVQRAAATAVAQAREAGEMSVLALHIEGPHFEPQRRGTHKAEMIRPISDSDLSWLASLQDFPVIVTLAPEHTAPGQIHALAAAGLIVCAGHTNATYEQIQTSIDEGLRGFTHLFNAMSPLEARAPGTVGAALESDSTWAGIIADGHHVHPTSIRLAHRTKAPGKLLLVSDAMSTVGGPAHFEIYGEQISAKNGRLVNAEGKLAGSAIALIDAVRIAHEEAGIALGECLRMASLYPATFLGMDEQLGRLQPGYRADMLAFDKKYCVSDTWVAGQHQRCA
ncbi:N-acetylglucosamine-6-phosphate deacetylase [marine gamma proteobacterium HTCC2148]|nr:N-acetylglucosamine-6-phosphate deacetylase [marine gamma proteobacterium HTCC2148]